MLQVALGKDIGDCVFHTIVRDSAAVAEVTTMRSRAAGATRASLGRVHVTTRCVSWRKENIVVGKKVFEAEFKQPQPVALDIETDAFWWEVPPEIADRLAVGGQLPQALMGVKNLVLSLLPSVVACGKWLVGRKQLILQN